MINMGTTDRVLRAIAGVGLLAFAMGYLAPGTGFNWLGWIGVVPLLTAAIGNCPAYTLLGIRTCPLKQ